MDFQINNGWDLILLPIEVAAAIVDKIIELAIRLWHEIQTWAERTRNYWRFDNPDHDSPAFIARREADERWFRYVESDEGKRWLGKGK